MHSSQNSFLKKLERLQIFAQKQIERVYDDLLIFDPWVSDIGYGLTGVCQGRGLEKAAVSISTIKGNSLPPSASLLRTDLQGFPYEVSGLSVIFHPFSPLIPTAHANIRKFTVFKDSGECVEWFGGGVDLTPFFPIEEDCQFWHQSLKQYIDAFDPALYAPWRLQCDRYFFLKHRGEPRGLGGVFFDDYRGLESLEETESFLEGLMEWFFKRNFELALKYRNHGFTKEQKAFQTWRRGRYVEFNLLSDRGTLFGLQSGGRTESILLSLPPLVSWIYQGEDVFRENNDLLVKSLKSHQYENLALQKS